MALTGLLLMGYRLTWTETLGAMLEFGPNLQLKARCGSCDTWPTVDLLEWARAYGAEFSFWDWIEPCDRCGRALTFLCSPGPGTPMLPMWTEAGRLEALKLSEAAFIRDLEAQKRKRPPPGSEGLSMGR
ncbi:MAG: hypothetical protein EON90_01990 [Brevundimonas sp.]|nr:MAG: hypothetical protein EON90_01990 [Brevundimonas sp.]